MEPIIHVFCGTKAQYMKFAPLLHRLEERGVDHRLIDSGQHATFNRSLRPSIGVREPDVVLTDGDARTITRGLRWLGRMSMLWLRPRTLRRHVFGGRPGICVVHGDTASTLVGALLARRVRMPVAMVEAGLRSGSFASPFPEELIRTIVPHLSRVVFPPDDIATRRLERMRVKARVVPTSGNTIAEVLFEALGDDLPPPGQGPVLLQLHRTENLHHSGRLTAFVDVACRIAADHPTHFVLHEVTEGVLARAELRERLERAGVTLTGLLPSYTDFARLLHAARFVVSDGASLQEEAAAIGVPMLLWRARTERGDGLGRNVVLSRHDPAVIDAFLADPQRLRREPTPLGTQPSAQILDALLEEIRAR